MASSLSSVTPLDSSLFEAIQEPCLYPGVINTVPLVANDSVAVQWTAPDEYAVTVRIVAVEDGSGWREWKWDAYVTGTTVFEIPGMFRSLQHFTDEVLMLQPPPALHPSLEVFPDNTLCLNVTYDIVALEASSPVAVDILADGGEWSPLSCCGPIVTRNRAWRWAYQIGCRSLFRRTFKALALTSRIRVQATGASHH